MTHRAALAAAIALAACEPKPPPPDPTEIRSVTQAGPCRETAETMGQASSGIACPRGDHRIEFSHNEARALIVCRCPVWPQEPHAGPMPAGKDGG